MATKCKREGCCEEVDRSESRWPYCSNLCLTIDVPEPEPFEPEDVDLAELEASLDTDPPPAGIPAGTYELREVPYVDAEAILANEPVLSTDDEERKRTPIFSGVLNYFPLAVAAVARVSKRGNDKHNPGEPLHWQRDKSTDQEDCIARHLIDAHTQNPITGEYDDAAALAWRALALLQALEEKRLGKPYSRGSR